MRIKMEITTKPIEKIVILEEIKYDSPRALFSDLVAGVPPGAPVTAMWTEGVVFRHNGLPLNSEPVIKERMEGKVYWSSVKYAEMPKHKESESIEGQVVRIAKAYSPALREVARELKERMEEGSHD
ncbi:hypothetical protein AKJ41_04860 [candidate division MSBL1 archaeon SCGC-AAA259O05]|uniref:Uncharacterized protein n=2 Tax=candidate division MSBL1 TaxID=215777 RepID=A0A133V039_9EURY|nr:hypothetical protein AKJ57_05740 [candidate division MSBL1 archaeon SCGC-AAA259A05]KXA99796.1 hypothetical protein AKJ41_04860 [candidate division MSBL1 archaeon SCGC-AAA259O05]